MADLFPQSEADVVDAVQAALASNRTLEILGLGSKRAIGRPVRAADTMTLNRLTGILAYDPAELVLTALAGTPLSEIDAALTANRQHLAFEPFRPLALLGTQDQTLGGLVAAALPGPRRLSAGSTRDHVLGFKGVSGRGEAFKAGGKVVKNVTGFDLSKLMAGSWGTLAVLTEITVKVLPAPETEATFALPCASDLEATAFLARAMGSPAEVSGAAIHHSRALLRLEGIAASVAYRAEILRALTPITPVILPQEASRATWAALRNAEPLAAAKAPIWRVSVTPSEGPRLVAALRAASPADALYDWQGGLIWLATDLPGPRLRTLIAQHGTGHATLIRAPEALRTACFQPQDAALAALTGRVKAAFDPQGVLNPGRMD
jgi:glycolate oxidase FAD binding subunit